MKKILLIVLLLLPLTVSAEVKWTDDNWRGKGVGVNNVYLQWKQHWVQFYGTDGRSYFYYWGESDMPDKKAEMIYTMLLTAFTANKKVSVAYDITADPGGQHEFSYLNIHN